MTKACSDHRDDVWAKFEISVDALVRTARELIGSACDGKSGYPVEWPISLRELNDRRKVWVPVKVCRFAGQAHRTRSEESTRTRTAD